MVDAFNLARFDGESLIEAIDHEMIVDWGWLSWSPWLGYGNTLGIGPSPPPGARAGFPVRIASTDETNAFLRLLIVLRAGQLLVAGTRKDESWKEEAIPKAFWRHADFKVQRDPPLLIDATGKMFVIWADPMVHAARLSEVGANPLAQRRLDEAVRSRLAEGKTPGSTEPWKSFCDAIRLELGVSEAERGFSDASIKRSIRRVRGSPDRSNRSNAI